MPHCKFNLKVKILQHSTSPVDSCLPILNIIHIDFENRLIKILTFSLNTKAKNVLLIESISRNFDHKCSEPRCEVRKFVVKFIMRFTNQLVNYN